MEGASRRSRVRLLESVLTERTEALRRALRALSRAKKANKSRVLHGEKPVIAGKVIPIKQYVRKYGKPKRTTEAEAAVLDPIEDEEIADIFDSEDVAVAVDLLRDGDVDDLRSFVVERAQELGHVNLIPEDWATPVVKPIESDPLETNEEEDEDEVGEIELDDAEAEALDDEEVEVEEEYAAEYGDADEYVPGQGEDDGSTAPLDEAVGGSATGTSAKAPKYIFGRLNKAYRKNATDADVQSELGAIKGRAQAAKRKGGDAAVKATFMRNMERKARQAIIARAKAKYGKAPSAAAVEATLRKWAMPGIMAMAKRIGAPAPKRAVAKRATVKTTKAKTTKAAAPRVGATAKTAEPRVAQKPTPRVTKSLIRASTDGEGVVLAETVGQRNVFDVLVIRPGMSKNGRRYRRPVLEASVPLLEGARSFASAGEDHDPQHRGVKSLVGWWTQPRYETKVELPNGKLAEGIVARYHVTDRDLAETLSQSIDGGKPDLITFSIVADGEVARVTESGRTLVDVVRINAYESVDPVINAAAGGMAVRLVASVEDPSMDWARLTLAEAVKGLVSGEITAVDLQSNRPDLFEAIETGRVTAADPTATKPADAAPEADVKGTIAEALAPFQTERLVETVLVEHARLPEAVKARIRESATVKVAAEKRVLTKEEVAALVESETEYLAALNPAVVTNAGPVITDQKTERERVTESMYEIISGKSNASFRALYQDLTGDRAMTGKLQEGGRLTESITTATFAEILGDSITRRMLEVYSLPDLSQWREIVNVVPVNDFRTQRRIRIGGYGNLPAVAQGNPYTALSAPGDEEATYSPSKRGGTEDITMETIANDDLGAIRAIPTRLGRAGAQTLFEYVFDFLRNNGNIYDSAALAVAGHSNLGSTALSATTLIAGRTAMKKQTDMSNGKRLGIKPKWLIVPLELEQTAYELTETDREVASANNTVNFIRSFSLQPMVVDYWTDTNNWWLVADKNLVPTIEIGFFNGREEPEIFLQDMPNVGSVFSNDTLTYKIRHIYGGAVVDYRGFYGAVVA